AGDRASEAAGRTGPRRGDLARRHHPAGPCLQHRGPGQRAQSVWWCGASLATARVETDSKMDEVIFEEFKGTGNMDLRLRPEFSEKRIFPAIDVDASSTRREELLMGKEELAIVWKLRRVLSGLESLQGLEMLLDRLRKTQSNAEFLMAITKTIPSQD